MERILDEDFSKYNGAGTKLKKAQEKMLNILIEVDKICQRHEIPYWLDFGTLLGTVRHNGFIPWDDDLDIACFGKDYAKLTRVLQEELPSTLRFQDWKNEKKLLMKMGKVRDINSYVEEALYKKGALKYQGIYIDIFPIVRIPSLSIRKKVDFFYGRAMRRLRGFSYTPLNYGLALIIWPFVNLLVLFSNGLNRVMGKDKYSNMYGSLTLYCEHDLSDILPLTKMNFEGHSFFVPSKTDKYLRQIYGDYTVIPPPENRKTHAEKIEIYD